MSTYFQLYIKFNKIRVGWRYFRSIFSKVWYEGRKHPIKIYLLFVGIVNIGFINVSFCIIISDAFSDDIDNQIIF